MAFNIMETLDTSSESHLILTDKYRQMIDYAKTQTVFKNLAAKVFTNIPGSSYQVEMPDADSLAFHLRAEGAQSVLDNETYSELTFTPQMWSADIKMTYEAEQDYLFDVMDMNMKTTAYEAAKKIDNLCARALEQGAVANTVTHVVTGGTPVTNANLVAAMRLLEDDDYTCSDVVFCAEHIEDLRDTDTFVEANKLGNREEFQTGYLGVVHGMRVWHTNNEYTTGSSYVIDKNYAFAIAEKMPLSLKPWEDVRRGLKGFTAYMRFDTGYLRKEACSQIT